MNCKDGKFKPYVAQVNHNTINPSLVVGIASTMLGNYCQDKSADFSHIQDMGADAGVLFGYNEKVHIHTLPIFQYLNILPLDK